MEGVQKVFTAASSGMGDLRILVTYDKAPATAATLFDKRLKDRTGDQMGGEWEPMFTNRQVEPCRHGTD